MFQYEQLCLMRLRVTEGVMTEELSDKGKGSTWEAER